MVSPDKSSQSSQQKFKKIIIVDTCVVQSAGNKNKAKSTAVLDYLKQLYDERYALAISEITVFENLQGLWGDKAAEASKVLASFEWKEISRDVLIMASMLGGLYSQAEVQKSQISSADKLIASTAFLLDGLILTTDYKDFPAPFFSQFIWHPVTYGDSHHTRTLDLILYQPNYKLISRKISENEDK